MMSEGALTNSLMGAAPAGDRRKLREQAEHERWAGFSSRARNALINAGYETPETAAAAFSIERVDATVEQLQRMPNVGHVTLLEILKNFGVKPADLSDIPALDMAAELKRRGWRISPPRQKWWRE